MSEICDAYSKVSRAYVCKLKADSVAGNLKQSLDNACVNIEQAASKLMQAAQPTVVNAPETSYADVVSRSRGSSRSNNANWPLHKVSLAGRKMLPIKSPNRIIIGPIESAKESFPSSKTTKDALLKVIINPTQLKLSISRVVFGPNNSVILEDDSLDADALSSCTDTLTEASLEVKPNVKLNPRLIIHDVPVEYNSDAIDCG